MIPTPAPMAIKVCGITNAEDAAQACAEGAIMGEHRMKSGDPAQALERLVAA
jgi:hypothetical protein